MIDGHSSPPVFAFLQSLVDLQTNFIQPWRVVFEIAEHYQPPQRRIVKVFPGMMNHVHQHHGAHPPASSNAGAEALVDLTLQTARQVPKHHLNLFKQFGDTVGFRLGYERGRFGRKELGNAVAEGIHLSPHSFLSGFRVRISSDELKHELRE